MLAFLAVDALTVTFVSIIGIILLSIPVIIVMSVRYERERRRRLAAYAATQGFQFTQREHLPKELSPLEFFREGSQGLGFSRNVQNLMRGVRSGIEIMIFDYWWTRVAPISGIRSTKRATVVCLRKSTAEAWSVFYQEGLKYVDVDALPKFVDSTFNKWVRESQA